MADYCTRCGRLEVPCKVCEQTTVLEGLVPSDHWTRVTEETWYLLRRKRARHSEESEVERYYKKVTVPDHRGTGTKPYFFIARSEFGLLISDPHQYAKALIEDL